MNEQTINSGTAVMPASLRIEDCEACIPPEVDELWKRWRGGALARHVLLLTHFITQHRDRITALAGSSDDTRALIRAAKQLVIEAGTVHAPTEMRDQMREIHNDIWYHGERGPHDPEQVASNWTTQHARSWRHWRLKEYLFVIDRMAGDLIQLTA